VVQELVASGADLFVTAATGRTVYDLAHHHRWSNVVDYLLRVYEDGVSAREGLQAIHSILQTATFLYVAAHPQQALSLQVQLPLGKLTLDHFSALLGLIPDLSFHSPDNNGALPLHIAVTAVLPLKFSAFLCQNMLRHCKRQTATAICPCTLPAKQPMLHHCWMPFALWWNRIQMQCRPPTTMEPCHSICCVDQGHLFRL